jgi:hypothetical protein
MHQVERTIREIAAADLPKAKDLETGIDRPATDDALANLGLVRLRGDYFSCAEMHVGPDSASLAPERDLPGTVLSRGTPKERFKQLPDHVKNKVMKARVFRAKDPSKRAKEVVQERVARRGDIPPGQAGRRKAELEEARAAAREPDAEIAELLVSVEEIDVDGDVVHEIDIIPHVWAGERVG